MAGIYIHVPFCQSRCAYCDFYSTTSLSLREAYVDMVCRELEGRMPDLQGQSVSTVYFGGGTPSTLRIADLQRILHCIAAESERLGIPYHVEDAEITLEANPDDLTEAYVCQLRGLPVNRISIGIQSFHNRTLRLVGRRHTAWQAVEAVRRCQRLGLTNISVDLIYGMPGESIEDWGYSLQQVVALKVPHISAYHLTYEEGTRLWKMQEQGLAVPIDEEHSVRAFCMLRENLLAAGYEHYEISNFALPGCCSRHNSSYWHGVPYLGIGPGAHSYDGLGCRRWNLGSLADYVATIEGADVPHELEHLTADELYDERVITELRTAQGVDLVRLAADFGDCRYCYCMQCAKPYIERGQLVQTPDNHLCLTPESLLVSDAVMRDLLAD